MNLPFVLGFEDGGSAGEYGTVYGALRGSDDYYGDKIPVTVDTDGMGNRHLRVYTRLSNNREQDRGLVFALDLDHTEVWFGARTRVYEERKSRAFYLATNNTSNGNPHDPVFSINIHPLSSESISLSSRDSHSTNTWNSYGISSSDYDSGPDWRFNPYGDMTHPENPWRYVAVQFVRRANDGDVRIYVDGIERVTALADTDFGLDRGNISEIGLAGFSASNDSLQDFYVEHDDFWLHTEELPAFHVAPIFPSAVGSYDHATPIDDQATPLVNPTLADMINDFPANISTYLSIKENDAISFFLDDSSLTANKITGISLVLWIAGPGDYTVFAKDGASEAIIGYYSSGGSTPEKVNVDLPTNPITGLAWTPEDISTVEIGVRNELLPEGATPGFVGGGSQQYLLGGAAPWEGVPPGRTGQASYSGVAGVHWAPAKIVAPFEVVDVYVYLDAATTETVGIGVWDTISGEAIQKIEFASAPEGWVGGSLPAPVTIGVDDHFTIGAWVLPGLITIASGGDESGRYSDVDMFSDAPETRRNTGDSVLWPDISTTGSTSFEMGYRLL